MKVGFLIFVAILVFVAVEVRVQGYSIAPVALTVAAVTLAVGVAHGLFDAILAASVWRISLRRATAFYASGFLFCALLGWLFPAPALAVHLAVSAYHFGQTEWGEPGASKRWRQMLVFLWGAALVAVMILGTWSDSAPTLVYLAGAPLQSFRELSSETRAALLALFTAVGSVTAILLARDISNKEGGVSQRLLDTLLLNALFIVAPLWLAFPLFLSAHGVRTLDESILPALRSLAKKSPELRNLLYAAGAAMLGTLVALVFVYSRSSPGAVTSWSDRPGLFAFLLAVTLPHATVMTQLARVRQKQLSLFTAH